MPPKVTIRTPFPTLEETAAALGVSKKRAREIEAMVRQRFGAKPAREIRASSPRRSSRKAAQPTTGQQG